MSDFSIANTDAVGSRDAGHGFMSYGAAQARLRKALVGVAAGDAPALVKRVFPHRRFRLVCHKQASGES